MSTSKGAKVKSEKNFVRLSEVDPTKILAHMSDPRVAEHMPLLRIAWNAATEARFVAKKEECWRRDGLGHWALLSDDRYVGWGGFQKEGAEWDFGLVLRPDAFGLRPRISRKAIDFAISDVRIPYVTFLLPPSRTHLRAVHRLGAWQVDEVDYDGETFLKFQLATE